MTLTVKYFSPFSGVRVRSKTAGFAVYRFKNPGNGFRIKKIIVRRAIEVHYTYFKAFSNKLLKLYPRL